MRLVLPLWDVVVLTFFSVLIVLVTAWIHRNFGE